jgi:hypothetical protein
MLRILNFCSSPELCALKVLIFWADFTDLGFGEEWHNTQHGKLSKYFAIAIYVKIYPRSRSTMQHPEKFLRA